MMLKQKVASLSDKFPNQRLQSHQTNTKDKRRILHKGLETTLFLLNYLMWQE